MSAKGTCSECGPTESSWFSRGLCAKHYKRAARAAGVKYKRWVSDKICLVDGCGSPVDSHGLCSCHVYRWKAHGDPLKTVRASPHAHGGRCAVSGCDKSMAGGAGRGMCPMHYQRWRQHGDINYVRADLLDRSAPCCVDGCGKIIGKWGALGMCRKHARIANRAARPEHYKAKLEARRHRVRVQTPPWADMAAIEAIYAATPAGHEVDHGIPLKGRLVSGLHVETNLQYLPLSANRRKGNRT